MHSHTFLWRHAARQEVLTNLHGASLEETVPHELVCLGVGG